MAKKRRLTGLGAAHLTELAHWRDLRLDYVVAGFPRCGSASLWLNLNEHPALRHSAPVTDPAAMGPEDWLFWELGTWMLPPARTLSAFHASRKHHGAERNGL